MVKPSDGCESHTIPLDMLVLATGFSTPDYMPRYKIIGQNGVDLAEHFDQLGSAEALYGTMMESMPNFFWTMGPATAGPHTMITFSEKQGDFVVEALKMIKDGKCSTITPKTSAIRRYNDGYLDDLFYKRKHVQAYYSNVSTWARTGRKGRVTGVFPYSSKELCGFLEKGFEEEDYEMTI